MITDRGTLPGRILLRLNMGNGVLFPKRKEESFVKRLLALLFCVTFLFCLAGCGESVELPNTPSTEKESVIIELDPSVERKFLATDITNHSIVVYDLNRCGGDFEKLKDDDTSIIWEWDADEDGNCKLAKRVGAGIDSAKYRYSGCYKRDVIIACSSSGWAGVIDYKTETVIWEYNIGKGPHSIEMLPNGDVVVACSSDPGALVYVPLSAGIQAPVSSIPSLYCHGVSWDPQNECLWVLEDTGVYAAVIENMGTANGKLVRLSGSGGSVGTGGHAFSPIYGEPGHYWASNGGSLYRFNSETEEVLFRYDRSSVLSTGSIKGIASFPDGTVVQSVAGIGGKDTRGWSCDGFRIITKGAEKDIVTVVLFEPSHREFYKVQPFTKDYQ